MSVSLLAPQSCYRPPIVDGISDTQLSLQAVWPRLVQSLKADFHLFGLDVVQPLCIGWYNASVPEKLGVRVPLNNAHGTVVLLELRVVTCFEAERGTHWIRVGDRTLALLVGNSKSIWPSFLDACKCEPNLLACHDPLDMYVERTVAAALAVSAPGRSYRCFWSHAESDELSGSRYIAIQRMAHAAGLAYLDQQSHLCLHPKFGPWFALRCVIVFDGLLYNGPRKPQLTDPLPLSTREYIKLAIRCAQREPSTQNLQDAGQHEKQLLSRWKKWVAVREALSPCHPWRYCDNQLEYHYTKSKEVLEMAVRTQS